MTESQKFIVTVAETALTEWEAGTKRRMFPMDPEIKKTSANMLWNMLLNALAYGIELGIAVGQQAGKAADDE